MINICNLQANPQMVTRRSRLWLKFIHYKRRHQNRLLISGKY